jgi:putative hydrolase of the HAD superfamily
MVDVPMRAIVFDIGGILEVVPEGGDPTMRFPQLFAAWNARLGLAPGELGARMSAVDERMLRAGKNGSIGTCTEEEWLEALRDGTGMTPEQMRAFLREFWDIYCGSLNPELADYFSSLRPRYRTALLSNSWVGARREEEARFHFAAMTDLIVYSHESGCAKPDPRIFALTCERLGVQPEETVFLDDVPANVAAAQASGLRAILFTGTAQAIAEIEAYLRR